MVTVITARGKRIEMISAAELRDPLSSNLYVRAYCHIHGSDHQRSLSINRTTGWGHCFNAACHSTVLVAEWNPTVASQLTRSTALRMLDRSVAYPVPPAKKSAAVRQLTLLQPTHETPEWQQAELQRLQFLNKQMSQALLSSRRAQDYMLARGISPELAAANGIGYLPHALFEQFDHRSKQQLARWVDRIIFPLQSPYGIGYIGRTLWNWRPGMDENRHKALLDQRNQLRRWIKTNPAGWFSEDFQQLAEQVILVEGGFDRLTLLQAGFAASEVVALVGTAAHVDWLPAHVKSVVLALDGDQGGKEASWRLAEQFIQAGLSVQICLPPHEQDRWGKDWNERWHTLGIESIQPLFATLQVQQQAMYTA